MSTEIHRENNGESDALSMTLAREIRALDAEIQPSRDLWRGIERRMLDHPQKAPGGFSLNWLSYGVAASLIVGTTALMVSLWQPITQETQVLTADRSFNQMEAEYVQLRNPLVKKFTELNSDLDEQTLDELYRNLDILESARRDIEAQVREAPSNRRLIETLMRIHEQELELLKQDFTRNRMM